MACDSRIENIKNYISSYPDFPKPGILFRDCFPIFRNPTVLDDVIALFCDHIVSSEEGISGVVGLEARGFLLGPLISTKLRLPFIPVRKAGKLPGEVVKKSFQLEYGQAEFEIQKDSIVAGQKLIIVDDLLATGGTMEAAVELLDSCGASVIHCLVIMELKDLKGREKIKTPVYSLVQY